MPEPSPEELRAALWRSFAQTPAAFRLRSDGIGLAQVVSVLDAELRTPGGARQTPAVPRPVLGVALWNLALRHLTPGLVPERDLPAVADLSALVREVFGWSLAQIDAMRRQNVDPLLMLARHYNIFDYRWTPPRPDVATVDAKLEVLVQSPLDQLGAVIDPVHWPSRCGLFWTAVAAPGRPAPAPQRPGTKSTLDLALELPGAEPERRSPVRVEYQVSETALGRTTAFAIQAAGGGGAAQRPLVLCEGTISIQRERGQPWATRIEHAKRMSVAAGAPRDQAADTLTYWLQSETVCLVLPQ